MKRVKLSDLILALESGSPELDLITRVDRQEASVVSVDKAVLQAVEEGDEDALTRLPE